MATKALRALARHHLVDRVDAAPPAARSAASKLPGDMLVSASSRTRPSLRRGVADCGDVIHGMAERDGLKRGRRRLNAGELLKALVLQRALDGAQPVGPFRMAGAA